MSWGAILKHELLTERKPFAFCLLLGVLGASVLWFLNTVALQNEYRFWKWLLLFTGITYGLHFLINVGYLLVIRWAGEKFRGWPFRTHYEAVVVHKLHKPNFKAYWDLNTLELEERIVAARQKPPTDHSSN